MRGSLGVNTLMVPPAVREQLGGAGSDGLVMMFAEAYRIGTEQLDHRIAESSASFERRLHAEISSFRLEMIERMSDLRFDLLKWNFLFWIGQLAAMTGILALMLRGVN